MAQRTCAVKDCDRPVSVPSRGFCRLHYIRWRRDGDPGVAYVRPPKLTECSVDGCQLLPVVGGYCNAHYQRWIKFGDPGDATVHTRIRGRVGCDVEGCTRPHCAQGYCKTHYRRWQEHGDPTVVLKPNGRNPRRPCTIEGCEGLQVGRGFCSQHYQRWRANGDPLVSARLTRSPCTAAECDQLALAKGLCASHYDSLRRHGHLDAKRRVPPLSFCTVDECTEPPDSRGLCRAHYNQWLRTPEWRAANAERIRQRRLADPIGTHIQRHRKSLNRRLRLNANRSEVSRRDLQRLLHRYRHACAYCGAPWEHLDHVVPLARGGSHGIGNLLPACASCNLNKRALFLTEWKRWQSRVVKPCLTL